ncbi:MAG TPA: hypothetical protein VKD08_07465 [Ignavibacteriaceae bacterium]|nr:hypothetical protein [Ignavibacteriaceae bacterium]
MKSLSGNFSCVWDETTRLDFSKRTALPKITIASAAVKTTNNIISFLAFMFVMLLFVA